MKCSFNGKHVFITGGSSGIGLSLARMFSACGASVTIMARREDQLAAAIKEISALKSDPAQQFLTLRGDVADMQAVMKSLAAFEKAHGTPDILINSAGITYPGEFQNLSPEILRDLMSINYLGTAYVTRAFINGMIQRGSGHIVNISSMAGFIGTYGYSGYGASKYAVRGFSEVLRAELKPLGIQVSIVYPPDTQTPQLDYEKDLKPAITQELADNAGVMSADAVATSILKGIQAKHYTILPGFNSWFYYVLSSILGDLTFKVMDGEIRSAMKRISKRTK
jgi:3-dehydrosphinganine reductase